MLTLCNHLLFYHGSLNANNDILFQQCNQTCAPSPSDSLINCDHLWITNTPPKWSFSRTTRDPYGDHNHDQHLVSNRDSYDDHNHDQYLARDPYGDHNHLSHHQNIVVTPHDYLIVQVTIFLLSHIYLPT